MLYCIETVVMNTVLAPIGPAFGVGGLDQNWSERYIDTYGRKVTCI